MVSTTLFEYLFVVTLICTSVLLWLTEGQRPVCVCVCVCVHLHIGSCSVVHRLGTLAVVLMNRR